MDVLQANCDQNSSALSFAEYSQAWDFRNTLVGQLQVDMYNNASKDPNAGNASPLAVRVNQVPLNPTTSPLCPQNPFTSSKLSAYGLQQQQSAAVSACRLVYPIP